MKSAYAIAIECIVGIACIALPVTAHAQDYPDKPIRMLVPVLPGGAPDFGGRIVAERLSIRLGQKVVVENRAGAGGVIALEVLKGAYQAGDTIVVDAQPDGGLVFDLAATAEIVT